MRGSGTPSPSGSKDGPGFGKLVADWMTDGRTGIDHATDRLFALLPPPDEGSFHRRALARPRRRSATLRSIRANPMRPAATSARLRPPRPGRLPTRARSRVQRAAHPPAVRGRVGGGLRTRHSPLRCSAPSAPGVHHQGRHRSTIWSLAGAGQPVQQDPWRSTCPLHRQLGRSVGRDLRTGNPERHCPPALAYARLQVSNLRRLVQSSHHLLGLQVPASAHPPRPVSYGKPPPPGRSRLRPAPGTTATLNFATQAGPPPGACLIQAAGQEQLCSWAWPQHRA